MTSEFVTDKEIREYYEEKRRKGEEMKGLVPVKAKVAKEIGWVFSVRFSEAELSAVEQAADQKGMRTGAYIRDAALRAAVGDMSEAAGPKVDLTPSQQETLFQALRQVISSKPETKPSRRARRSNTAAQDAESR